MLTVNVSTSGFWSCLPMLHIGMISFIWVSFLQHCQKLLWVDEKSCLNLVLKKMLFILKLQIVRYFRMICMFYCPHAWGGFRIFFSDSELKLKNYAKFISVSTENKNWVKSCSEWQKLYVPSPDKANNKSLIYLYPYLNPSPKS